MPGTKIFFEDIKPFKLNRREIYTRVNDLILSEGMKSGGISLILVSDIYLLNINKKYLNHDYFTDIITFNNSEDESISGDLFISVDRVRENAEINGQSFFTELHRVIFHGLLHLIGYDDKDAISVREMRHKENFYLEKFGIV